ncbi:MAG TPA: hypothetical protein VFQ39_03610 [Longimicrobium sp.]|nr:hypothetical protein [Longimicrobium sp.]
MPRPRLRTLTQNWRLKLTALALAVLLWAVVSAEQPTSQWIPVRVAVAVTDPGWVLTGEPDPRVVRVRFTGPGRELWELAVERPVLELRVRTVGDARTFALDPSMVSIPQRLEVRATDVRPAVVRLPLERLATRDIPVRARISERSLQAYVVDDSVAVSPASVRLTGPEAAVNRIAQVATRAFEIVPDDSTFAREVELDTAGLAGVAVSPREVRVEGRVDRRVERAFAAVPVAAPPGTEARPAQVEVRVRGPERVLRLLFPANLRATVPADSLPSPLPLPGVDAPVRVGGLPRSTTVRTVPARVRVSPTAVAPPPPSVEPVLRDTGRAPEER